jgi:hypothetical protein
LSILEYREVHEEEIAWIGNGQLLPHGSEGRVLIDQGVADCLVCGRGVGREIRECGGRAEVELGGIKTFCV